MTTFNDLTKGVNMNQTYYIAFSAADAIDAKKNAEPNLEFYIVFSKHKLIEIYIDIKAIPNGLAVNGKIYEGKSKKQAISALQKL